jgi:nucleoside-diphosphate-sugar epimerase
MQADTLVRFVAVVVDINVGGTVNVVVACAGCPSVHALVYCSTLDVVYSGRPMTSVSEGHLPYTAPKHFPRMVRQPCVMDGEAQVEQAPGPHSPRWAFELFLFFAQLKHRNLSLAREPFLPLRLLPKVAGNFYGASKARAEEVVRLADAGGSGGYDLDSSLDDRSGGGGGGGGGGESAQRCAPGRGLRTCALRPGHLFGERDAILDFFTRLPASVDAKVWTSSQEEEGLDFCLFFSFPEFPERLSAEVTLK